MKRIYLKAIAVGVAATLVLGIILALADAILVYLQYVVMCSRAKLVPA